MTMTRFRPCIDLHQGQVKQIVGATLQDDGISPVENFVAQQPARFFAERFAQDGLTGGHVIKLGPGNDDAATEALAAYPGGLQIGGGISAANASQWIDRGASHVIVTSWLFDENGVFQANRLKELVDSVGSNRIVLDLSCKKTATGWTVAMNRWQTLTNLNVTCETLDMLAKHCDEFLIHAADVEGLCQGIDQELVEMMGGWGKIPMTYAGGVAQFSDVELVAKTSHQKVDVTVGSALDLFGGNGVRYSELLTFNRLASRD
jgi:phosphoribosylformimino-5-aminoimidazole carboxamide ribotide isomerase